MLTALGTHTSNHGLGLTQQNSCPHRISQPVGVPPNHTKATALGVTCLHVIWPGASASSRGFCPTTSEDAKSPLLSPGDQHFPVVRSVMNLNG
ncbi:hypothetical protein CKAH01_01772 [Colletotrichum kahawae]|uniref:Uncharacterized protein n=1 Tax=Colletotrichum kahawae TaxID=34407 RepID=A0AAE0D2F4_COLKA|nr:hypothetical protein CKAH01_01772 [Colletotrichum kahawae]